MALFKSATKPAVEDSQNISNLDSTGSVSSIANASTFLYSFNVKTNDIPLPIVTAVSSVIVLSVPVPVISKTTISSSDTGMPV